MKLLERILDGRIRKRVEQGLGEEQQNKKGRGTTYEMFALKQEVGDARKNGSRICGLGEGL